MRNSVRKTFLYPLSSIKNYLHSSLEPMFNVVRIFSKKRGLIIRAVFLISVFCMSPILADSIHIAAASNFSETLKRLSKHFEKKSGHNVVMAFGSTGKQYAQIIHGAPFDIFFAADTKRPKLLEKQGISVPDSRFTYAVGKLVLWSPRTHLFDDEKVLSSDKFHYLSIANPKLAPYGKAAKQILSTFKLWDSLQHRMVRGENIGQTFQFVKSGNAELGFIAYSQIKKPDQPISGSVWIPPESLYSPINQQVVLLSKNIIAHQFLVFIKSAEAKKIIQAYGYGIVDAK